MKKTSTLARLVLGATVSLGLLLALGIIFAIHSALTIVDPYLITHGAKDQDVSKTHHSDLLVRDLRDAGHTDVTYLEFPDMYHGHPWTYEGLRATIDFVSAGIPT